MFLEWTWGPMYVSQMRHCKYSMEYWMLLKQWYWRMKDAAPMLFPRSCFKKIMNYKVEKFEVVVKHSSRRFADDSYLVVRDAALKTEKQVWNVKMVGTLYKVWLHIGYALANEHELDYRLRKWDTSFVRRLSTLLNCSTRNGKKCTNYIIRSCIRTYWM